MVISEASAALMVGHTQVVGSMVGLAGAVTVAVTVLSGRVVASWIAYKIEAIIDDMVGNDMIVR